MTGHHIETEIRGAVGWLWLARPEKLNALSQDMWKDLPAAAAQIGDHPDVRAIVVAGRGSAFSVGIDLGMLAGLNQEAGSPAATSQSIYRDIKRLQWTFTALAECRQPVVAAVHGYCLGAGIDLITACDIRLASADAVFGIRETRMGLVADVGTMQRLPRILAPGHVAELVFGGQDIDAAEAGRIGLVNRVLPDPDTLHEAAGRLADQIAANSPLVVQGAKQVLRAQADMPLDAALDHMALWNGAFLRSNDLRESMSAHLEGRSPDYTGT